MRTLQGKVAVVTGGASGIGRGMAEAFLEEGMCVLLADVEAPALEATAAELSRRGRVLAQQTDVTRAEEVKALAGRAWDELGAVHVLCNNAGVAAGTTAWESSLDDWRWVIDVCLWGVVHGVHSFVPRMVAQGGEGCIVNTASLAGVATFPNRAPYMAAKQAVVGLSEALQQELGLARSPLRVSVLCPSFVRTNIDLCERNRPGRDARDMLDRSGLDDATRLVQQTGMNPRKVGAMVVDAIREERFYVFTHPERMRILRDRFEAILSGRCPAPPAHA